MAKLTNHQPASHVLVALLGEFLIYCSLIHPPSLELQWLWSGKIILWEFKWLDCAIALSHLQR
ncbi:MAG: hypothetical protein V7K14_02190 [Nostoc sp.]|uniref:hypothetical protein n=1 Tax=Nostoc sp. TaxID=1180 RepID=UPI002FF5C9CB